MTFSIITENPDRNCVQPGAKPNDWFPDDEPERNRPEGRVRYVIRARKLCGGCPVAAECLEAALDVEGGTKYMPAGIYGGFAPWERRAMIKRRERQAQHS